MIQSVNTIPVDSELLNIEGLDEIPLCDRIRPLYCKSNRGYQKLMLKGFGYNFRHQRGDVTVWRCDKRTKYGCMVSMEMAGDRIIREPVHKHPPDWAKFKSKRFKNDVPHVQTLPRFVQSKRGMLKLMFGGFQYTKHRSKGATTTWRCDQLTRGCRALLYAQGVTVNRHSRHSHSPDWNQYNRDYQHSVDQESLAYSDWRQ
ncbi:hypothetical protein LSTR_LSTR000951 [Laodelphax striatellus]|uniref:FLYWCH-type domain-containing protein n=1 Tax=Laodelphax striatellus TaxID=195883 RepID=A0A482X230_LAOST|nr:hypothetical protein LSTR_LSTR000951 [Laodelphax striatellus]